MATTFFIGVCVHAIFLASAVFLVSAAFLVFATAAWAAFFVAFIVLDGVFLLAWAVFLLVLGVFAACFSFFFTAFFLLALIAFATAAAAAAEVTGDNRAIGAAAAAAVSAPLVEGGPVVRAQRVPLANHTTQVHGLELPVVITVRAVRKADQVLLSGNKGGSAGGAVAPSGDVEGLAGLRVALIQLSFVCADRFEATHRIAVGLGSAGHSAGLAVEGGGVKLVT